MPDETYLKNTPPVALSIAGSDNSAGAGAQADLKTFSARGVYGLTALTCVVAEVPGCVEKIHPVPAEIVEAQIRLSLESFPVRAIKTGMLYSSELIQTICEALETYRGPIVVDPVMVATSGDRLLRQDAISLYTGLLFPRAAVITPNLDEAAVLVGRPIRSVAEMHEAGRELVARFGVPVLLKGGHLRETVALDLLFADGKVEEFAAPFVPGVSTHGTGCTYSSAIAAGLASGDSLYDAVAWAKEFVTRAIREFHRWPGAMGNVDALNHRA